MTETILDEHAVSEIEAQLNSGALLLPLRVEGWHMSLSDGGWHIKNASDRVVMTVRFVPVEIETGKPALEGNAPARHTAALLNSIPALCATVKHLRGENEKQRQGLEVGLRNAQLIDRIQAWSKCEDSYPLDEHINNITVERKRLQSQLEQLRAENESLKDQLGNIEVSEISRLNYRRKAIQLCKDKAAEHLRIADVRTKNLNDAGAMLAQARSDAINDIREELEKL